MNVLKVDESKCIVIPIMENVSESDIILSASTEGLSRIVRGCVTAANESLDIAVGDTVVFTKGDGVIVEYEGINYIILQEDEIICTIGEDTDVK